MSILNLWLGRVQVQVGFEVTLQASFFPSFFCHRLPPRWINYSRDLSDNQGLKILSPNIVSKEDFYIGFLEP